MEKYTITQLRDPDVQKQITAISTLYLPPKTVLKFNKQFAGKMSMVKAGGTRVPTYPNVKWVEREATSANAYEEFENAAIEQYKSHVIPEAYKPLSVSTAMVDLMTKLALDPRALATYRQDPTLVIGSTSGLTPLEANALKLGQQGAVIASMKGKPIMSASGNKVLQVNGISLQNATAAASLIFSPISRSIH
jgi:hypothetical protein